MGPCTQDQVPQISTTLVSTEAIVSLHKLIQQDTSTLDYTTKDRVLRHVQKLTNAAQISFVERALLHEHNEFLSQMNNGAKARRSTKSEILGTIRVMSYEDLEKARTDRAAKKAANEARRLARETRKAASNSIENATPYSIRSHSRPRKSTIAKTGTNVPHQEAARQAEPTEQGLAALDLTILAGWPFGREVVQYEIVQSPQRAPVAQMF